ncbi:Succinate dehydrogenase assembly factor 2, mitochondrial OS=Cryptococcus neoformans var, neoformans serotype D (strain JEC21 / ATCC MYA-565) GN=EMI5 PE=3 SV=1 [Rhizoctonia solani AG-1 IB]|uniref:Succinate dehydrogenase assembly factor 2, mitochondrial n=2 Tax=Rhizoctonia solani TaxID=456999 RepID=M5C0F2_THACB|nr:Succinate dehydrogenase assembly factor 2,mitochondrial Short=SDH assembly factor 2 [Rhizoctonia solani AG-1 IB]CEL57932.1 Succinate dehydrogenase assembly factor 2, mitochondrial OS=Cryptococcus neoformans var, neoformans serotype D (strain JEC21 / ATCC MYA-565) GN=EMI5 PE=3 SV=1 [Rhizoctonia solani AG-1 IB]
MQRLIFRNEFGAHLRARIVLLRHTSSKSGSPSFSDPFPLPLSRDVPQSNTSYDELDESLLPPPIPRHNESLSTLRARLVYQTRKRGTLESDLLLSTFAKEHLPKMSEHELKEFDKLLDEPDWDIYYWATNKKQPPPKWEGTALLDKLRVHAKNEGKVVRSMPALGGWTSSLSASPGTSKQQ